MKGHNVSTYQQLRNYEEEEREGKKKWEKIQCNSLYNQHIHVTMYSTLLNYNCELNLKFESSTLLVLIMLLYPVLDEEGEGCPTAGVQLPGHLRGEICLASRTRALDDYYWSGKLKKMLSWYVSLL